MKETIVKEIIAEARAKGRSELSEIESKRLLEALELPTVQTLPARTAEEAAELAAKVGFPAVLKVLSPEVIHKSDVGGVMLGLGSESEVKEAFERIRLGLSQRLPAAKFEGVAVQEMAPAGIELIVGTTRDRSFGPMVMAGLGGVFVEVLKDTALRLAPVTKADALAMLEELRGAALLRGARGGQAVDVQAIAGLLATLSEFAAANPEVMELDLNPVVAWPEGFRVLDARVLLDPGPRPLDDAEQAGADSHRQKRRQKLANAFEARTVAVIGDKRMNGYLWLRAMSQFKGRLYSVQIDPAEIPGIEAMGVENRKSLAEIPEPIDYAVSAVPRHVAPRILKDSVANGVGAISFFTSGFSETGENTGRRLEEDLRRIALESDIALVGPNCMGLYNPSNGLANFPGLGVRKSGDVCFISQSGTHTINFSLQAEARGIGVNKAASIGNAIVLEAADYLDLMADDPATRAIGMYIEGVRDGVRFFQSLKRAAARHPVVVWKGGLSEAGLRATFSHTASLATPRAVWGTAIRQSGAVEVGSLDAMLDALELFARGHPVRGRRMGLVAMTGGQSVVITDTFALAGLEVPLLSDSSYAELKSFFNIVGGSYRNPLDAGGTIGSGLHQGNLDRILYILRRDPAIDAIVLEIGTGLRAQRWASNEDELQGMLDRLGEFAREVEKPFAVVLHPAHLDALVAHARELARARGLVAFDSFERAAAAFSTAARYWERRASLR